MPKFLFWNLGRAGNDILPLIKSIMVEHDVDLLVLAECNSSPVDILGSLNETSADYQFSFGNCERLRFFTRFEHTFLVPLYESSRVSIRRLSLPGRNSILVAGAHLPSKLHTSEVDLTFECSRLAQEISRLEDQEGHRRTVLLGDLNANPFEPGISGAGGLNAVMNRRVALRGSRTVQSRQYRYFYNPMWSHLGDRTERLAGTFFYDKAQHVNYFSNIFDQVLLRPELVRAFNHDQVQILSKAGGQPLTHGDGRPNKKIASDHLPVLLQVDF